MRHAVPATFGTGFSAKGLTMPAGCLKYPTSTAHGAPGHHRESSRALIGGHAAINRSHAEMLSFARNECGIRLASAAIVLLPVVAMIFATSRSSSLDLVVALMYCAFAAVAFMALLLERAEENENRE